jgi:hypothetical protein
MKQPFKGKPRIINKMLPAVFKRKDESGKLQESVICEIKEDEEVPVLIPSR